MPTPPSAQRYATSPSAAPLGMSAHLGLRPPLAPRHPRIVVAAGIRRLDEFAWLEDLENPLVTDLIDREHAYAGSYFSRNAQLRAAARQLQGRAPAREALVAGGPDHPSRLPKTARWAYSAQTDPKSPYHVTRLVRTSHRTKRTQLVADLDRLAPRRAEYLAAVSPDDKLVAILLDRTGCERYELVVLDIASQEVLLRRRQMGASVAWYPDSAHLLAISAPRRGVGLAASALVLSLDGTRRVVRRVTEPHVLLSAEPTSDAEWMVLGLAHSDTSELWAAPATPDAEFFPLVDPLRGRTVIADHHAPSRSWILAVTDDDASRVLSVPEAPGSSGVPTGPLTDDALSKARVLFEAPPDATISSHAAFARQVAVFWQRGTSSSLSVVTLDRAGRPTATHHLDCGPGPSSPAPLSTFDHAEPVGSQPVGFESSVLHFVVERPHRPSERHVYDMATRTTRRVDLYPLGDFGPELADDSPYVVDELLAHAPDATAIPITVVRHRDTPLDATAPCLVVAYGAYGSPLGLRLTSMDRALMDRGVVVAHCHVRGGGEYGRHWHNQGRLFAKATSVADLVACITHLAATYVDRHRIAGWGGSAAGVLFGAAVNWRPELLRALCLRVPFLDPLSEMADPMSRLAPHEYCEWGDPKLAEQHRAMGSWSPYENLAPGQYPAVLVTCARNDARVSAAGILKWVQRLRRVTTSDHPVLVDMRRTGGHAASDAIRELTFLCTELTLGSPHVVQPPGGAKGTDCEQSQTRTPFIQAA